MSLLSTSITNLFNGVSQQPAELRDPSQAAAQVNAVSSPSYGLRKRPGTTHVAKIGSETSNPVVHFVDRDRNEQYAVVASDGAIEVYDVQTGAKVQVATPDGTDYLKCGNPQEDLRLVSVADYTFVVNTKRPVQLSASLVDAKDQLAGTISFPIPLVRPPVLVPTDPTKTPGPGGTTTNPPLPGYGGNPGGGGTGGGWPGTTPTTPTDPTKPTPTPDKPKDPSNPTPETPPDTGGGTDPGTGGGGTGPGTGGGTPGTGGGGTTPTDPTEPTEPTGPPPATIVFPNADGTWPTLESTNHSYHLPNAKTLMPPAVGDHYEVFTVLKNRGFWNHSTNQLLVLYRPQVSVKVRAGNTGGPVLAGCFATDYHFSEPGRIYAMVSAYLAAGGKYVAIPRYERFSAYYDGVNQSFPQLTWPTSKNYFDTFDEIAATPGAAFRTFSGSQQGGIVIRDPLSFDACYVFLLEETETGARHCEAIPVRVSVMGFAGGHNAPGTSGAFNLLAGDPNRNYSAGGYRWNSAAEAFNIPFIGFTSEFNRMVSSTTYGWNGGIPDLTGLTIDTYRGNGIPYARGPGGAWTEGPLDLYFPGWPLKFEPPMAFTLVPRATPADQLGNYTYLYAPGPLGELYPTTPTVYS